MQRLAFVFIFSVIAIASLGQTFNKDIAPIIRAHCVACHKPGEATPFSLLNYEDVVKRSKFIKKVVETRYMPPWKADESYVHYSNNRQLHDSDIALISKWVDAGAPRGTGKAVVIAPIKGTEYSRKPDLTLQVKAEKIIKGDNVERFILYKIPFELPDSANVEAIEFFSTNKKIIHHANFAIHPVADTSINIYNTDNELNLTDDDRTKYRQYLQYKKLLSFYGGWIPGSSFEAYPKGFGWVMPKRGIILLTVHYSPLAKDESNLCGINLFFTKDNIARKVKVISLGSGGIGQKSIEPSFKVIPPNVVSNYKLEIVNPSEKETIFYVWPHMHLIGKTFKAFAVTPLGDTVRLVNIPDWDFRWQEIYKLKQPAIIPKGSKIVIEASYDNTASNPFNPNSPPVEITSDGDMNTTQEMMTLLMIYVPYQDGDENISL